MKIYKKKTVIEIDQSGKFEELILSVSEIKKIGGSLRR